MLNRIVESFVMFRNKKIVVYLHPWPKTIKNEKGETLSFDFSYTFTYLENFDKEEFYFTDGHTVPPSMTNKWIPITATIPDIVKSRKELPTGFVTCLEDYVKVFLYDRKFMGIV